MIHRLAGLSNWPNPLTAFALKQAVRKPRLSCAIAGTILLTAAATKVYGLTTDPAAAFGDIASPSIRILVIELEMFLGMWLLSGGTQLVSWALGILTFTSFAGFNVHAAWIGRAYCGCFGEVLPASPRAAFALDITVLALLLAGRPPLVRNTGVQPARVLRWLFRVVFGVAASLLVVILVTALTFGSVDRALAYFRGERLSITPGILDFGVGAPGDVLTSTIQTTNRANRPIFIIGGTCDCSCLALEDLPVTLEIGQSRDLTVRVKLPQASGVFNREAFFLWLDDNLLQKSSFRVIARITPRSD